MYALSLIDDDRTGPEDQNPPWASLMEIGVKTDESRTWPIPNNKYPLGWDLLICASMKSQTKNRGLAVCVVRVIGCEKFTKEFEKAACCPAYSPGYVWHTENLRWLSEKFPVKGGMGIFEFAIPKGIEIYTPTQQQIEEKKANLFAEYGIRQENPIQRYA